MNSSHTHYPATDVLVSDWNSRTVFSTQRHSETRGRSLWLLPPGASRVALIATCVLFGSPETKADPVLEWDAIMEETVRSSDPMTQVRAAAITQLAVFEAVNSVVGGYEPYVDKIPVPPGASAEAAAIGAAHHALVRLYPDRESGLNGLRDASLAAIPAGPARDDGVEVGIAAAEALIALRTNDGYGATLPFTPGTGPGEWQPTPPAYASAVGAAWGRITPFGVTSVTRFRPPPPPPLRSLRFARDYNEVKRVGAADSVVRPPDRTDVARFYAVALGVECYHQGARQVSAVQGKSLVENARILALLSMAVCDSLIASKSAKYHYRLWRPVTAIRAGASDGNWMTRPDPNFLPLITTPPFPSYPSNHATMGGAARLVLDRMYGPRGHAITLSTPKLPSVVLHYAAWRQITDDIDDARIYGGIHFRFDQEAGTLMGRRIAADVLRHELRPVHDRDCD